MHADATGKAHEIRHRCRVVDRARRDLVDADVDIVIDHCARLLVLEDTVERGFVILALLRDLVVAGRGIVTLAAAGNPRHADQHDVGFLEPAVGDAVVVRKRVVDRLDALVVVLHVAGAVALADRVRGLLPQLGLERDDEALEDGFRLLSCYRTPAGDRLYIITEHDRSMTTILLPSEY